VAFECVADALDAAGGSLDVGSTVSHRWCQLGWPIGRQLA
jgi:hypothetical protein